MAYATPGELWQLALPPDSLFQEQGIEPGPISDVTHTAGAGLGSLDLDDASSPREAWTVRVSCVRAGELNVPGVVNPGPVPQLRVQLLDPTTAAVLWTSRTLTPDDVGRVKVQRGGFTLLLKNGAAGAPVTLGAGNASLVFTPLLAGASVQVLVGAALGYRFFNGALVLTVTNATSAAQATAYLAGLAEVAAYLSVAAGGDGSGVVQAAAKTAVPLASFTTSEVWTFTTQPSPDVVSALQVASDLMDGFFQSVWKLPLLAWPADVKLCAAQLARWQLVLRRGLDAHQDFKVYNPAELGTWNWLRDVQNGQLRPKVTQTPTGAEPFPELLQPLDPLGPESGALGI